MSTIQSTKRTAEDPRATTYTDCSNQKPELEEKVESLFFSLLHPVLMRSKPTNGCLLAVNHFMSVVDAYRKSGDKIKAAECYSKAANVYEENGDIKETANCYKLAADVCEENGDSRLAAEYYRLAANDYLQSGNKKEAAECYKAAGACREIEDKRRTANCYKEAAYYYIKAAEVYRESGDMKEATECYIKAAGAYLEIGDEEAQVGLHQVLYVLKNS